jgi:hypothetical protein
VQLSLGPSYRQISRALYGAYWNFANLVTLIFDRFNLPDREEWDQNFESRQFDFHRFTKAEVEGVGRNDPCPCGCGKKYKKCHEEQVTEFLQG